MQSLGRLRWLLGVWTARRDQTVTIETWTQVSADTFEGAVVSRSRDTNEIRPVESLRLVAMSEGVFYLAKVSEHDLPIAFKMTACEERNAVFENPEHDFPRVLAYRLDTDGLLVVRVTDGADEGFTVRYIGGDQASAG